MRFKILYTITVFALMAMPVFAAENTAELVPHLDTIPGPDKLISRKKIVGRLFNTHAGDYLYAGVRTDQGIVESFMVSSEVCFLVQNHKQILLIDYDEVERFIQEGAGYYPQSIMQKISSKDGKSHWDINVYVDQTIEQSRKCIDEFLALFKDRQG